LLVRSQASCTREGLTMGCLASSPAGASKSQAKAAGNGAPAGPRKSPPKASKGKWSDLHDACEENKPGEVQRLLQAGVNPNAGDKNMWTPLSEAVERKHTGCVTALLADGRTDPNLANKESWTPLMEACEIGAPASIVQALLNAKADPDFQNDAGWTCTMEAAEKRNYELVKILSASGADLNLTDNKGWTAFMAACEGGNVDCVRDLWIYGAEHNLQDQNRWTALEEAEEKGNKDVVSFMKPIVEAEKGLKKMVETDAWTPQEAMTYLERAQTVYCLKGLVIQASARLGDILQLYMIQKYKEDPEYAAQCLDWLMNYSPLMFESDAGAGIYLETNEGNNNSNDNQNNNSNSNQQGNANPEFSAAVVSVCRHKLQSASSSSSIPEIKTAISGTFKAKASGGCKAELAAAKKRYTEIMQIPPEWDVAGMLANMEDGRGRMLVKKPVDDAATLSKAQAFLDHTFRKKYTRDRRGEKVPDKLKLQWMVNVQNEQIYNEYKARLGKNFPAKGGMTPNLPQFLTKDGASFLPTLNPKIGEYWLFHGTKQEAADAITTTDFRLDLTGTSSGSMYGPGIYFSDSCSKADEYAVPDDKGLRCLILCRVALGRILYDDAVSPDARGLSQKCISGEYDSIFGDREKCRGTYKELIVFDDDLAYPEFLLYYRRVQSD